MFVYNLKNRQSVSINTQIYQLKFISMEGVRDHQTRISQSYYRINRLDGRLMYVIIISTQKKMY